MTSGLILQKIFFMDPHLPSGNYVLLIWSGLGNNSMHIVVKSKENLNFTTIKFIVFTL